MPDEEPRRGLSKEAWGAVTAITVAVIGAFVTLTTHFWSPSKGAPKEPPPPNASSTDAVAGHWAGTARDAGGGAAFAVDVTIARGCAAGARCGTIFVANTPCRGGLYLQTVRGNDLEFRVDDFEPPSDPQKCQAGAGEHLALQPDGTLLYTTSYSSARAVLTRQ